MPNGPVSCQPHPVHPVSFRLHAQPGRPGWPRSQGAAGKRLSENRDGRHSTATPRGRFRDGTAKRRMRGRGRPPGRRSLGLSWGRGAVKYVILRKRTIDTDDPFLLPAGTKGTGADRPGLPFDVVAGDLTEHEAEDVRSDPEVEDVI